MTRSPDQRLRCISLHAERLERDDVWRRADNLPVSSALIEADHVTLMEAPAVEAIARQINRAYAAEYCVGN